MCSSFLLIALLSTVKQCVYSQYAQPQVINCIKKETKINPPDHTTDLTNTRPHKLPTCKSQNLSDIAPDRERSVSMAGQTTSQVCEIGVGRLLAGYRRVLRSRHRQTSPPGWTCSSHARLLTCLSLPDTRLPSRQGYILRIGMG